MLTPQLATASKKIAPSPEGALHVLQGRGWLFDMKWDGVRCFAIIEDGDVRLINRNQRDITFKYPDVVMFLQAAIPGNGRWWLDGELIHMNEDGVPDFETLARRDRVESAPSPARVSAVPVAFVPFDALTLASQDATTLGYAARAAALTTLCERTGITHMKPTPHGDKLFEVTKAQGVEGIMAKDPGAPYRSGRQASWVKIKHVHRVTCIVRSYDLGDNSFSDTLGAMHLEMIHDGELVPVGRVGTGFSHDQRDEYRDRLDAGETLIVEVEYANVTGGGTLRFPSFKGERSDVGPDGCTLTQLETT